jgi:hypothetical protein
MDYRFGKPEEPVTNVENGGLFSKELCQNIAKLFLFNLEK